MPSNEQIILRDIVDNTKSSTAPDLTDSKFFEFFASDQILKEYDLTDEEIESGIVGDGNDGGIDSIYFLINNKLIFDDTDLSFYKKGPIKMNLVIIQAKTSPSFSGDVLDRFHSTSLDLFNLGIPLEHLKTIYNSKLLTIVGTFREAYTALATKLPSLTISYFYSSYGDTESIHQQVAWKELKLKDLAHNSFPDCQYSFSFLGAKELLKAARTTPSTTITLNLTESPISTQDGSYIGLVNLNDYYKFITTEEGKKREHIFESNVRDYQNDVEVNKGIRETLKNNVPEDFWWLNNGVTILATTGNYSGKKLVLVDPQIVNGLQTSEEIFQYFGSSSYIQEKRSILVKVIVTDDSSSRDKVIRATNSQNPIPIASLKASDGIQRNIEDYFKTKNFYYDRRKNYYKNHGFERNRIVSITYLAQAVVAILLKQPDDSKARPSTLLKNDSEYSRIFNSDHPIEMYLICVLLMKRVETFLKNNEYQLSDEVTFSLRFHIAMYVAMTIIGSRDIKPKNITDKIVVDQITDEYLKNCADVVIRIFETHLRSEYSADRIVKGKEFVNNLISNFNEQQN